MAASQPGARYKGWWHDPVANRLSAMYNGTEVFDFDANDLAVARNTVFSGTLEVTGAQTFTGAAEFAAAVGVADNVSIELGTDDDSVIRHKSAATTWATAVADVTVGTPVGTDLAANSLIISNVTANGDIAIAVNNGGNSEQAVFIDASAKLMTMGQTGWSLQVPNGAVKLTLGTASAFASTQPTNTLVMRSGTAPAGAITTAGGLFSTDTVVQKIIAAGTVSNVET